MDKMIDILIDIFPEFGLPEPETNYLIKESHAEISFLLAWPIQKIGIRKGNDTKVQNIGDWQIFECFNQASARVVLRSIGTLLNIESNVLRIDFSNVEMLFEAGQLDSARNEIDKLIQSIQQDHPDFSACNKWLKELRKAARQKTPEKIAAITMPVVSFPLQIKNDAARITSNISESFNILGAYSPQNETYDSIDAIWVGLIRDKVISPFVACVDSSPAYENDTNWQVFGSELELLETLLQKLEKKPTFIWGADKILTLINNWHYRLKGTLLSDIEFYDLEKIASVFSPLTHRTDYPDSFCKQRDIAYTDNMGLGGPLAASICLLNRLIEDSGSFSDELKNAIKIVLSQPKKKSNKELFDEEENTLSSNYLNNTWLELLFPTATAGDLTNYFELLKKYHLSVPQIIVTSEPSNSKSTSSYSVNDFLKKDGFVSRVTKFEYAERKEQIAFSQKIEDCHVSANTFVIEAGTGIGKTIGYLVPSLISANRTYIATHTKSLQDQAWFKDVPLIMEALSVAGIKKSATIIKGKGNYVCLQSVSDVVESMDEHISRPDDAFYIASVLHWLLLTQTGWLSEIEHLRNWKISNLISRDVAPPTLRAEWTDIDPHNKAKEAATKADLVIANHSYVILASQISDTNSKGLDVIIIDEAHNLENVVTEVLTMHFRPFALQSELQSLIKRDKSNKPQGLFRAIFEHKEIDSIAQIKEFSDSVFEYENLINDWCNRALRRLDELLQNIKEIDPDYPIPFELDDFWVPSLFEQAKSLNDSITKLSVKARALLEVYPTIKGLPIKLQSSLGSFEQHLNEGNAALADLFEKKNDWVHWGEAIISGKNQSNTKFEWNIILHSTPINISGWLLENFHTKFKHKAFVSATLTVGGSFEPICNRLGIIGDSMAIQPITGIYPSPFDYKKQALLAVPHDMPLANPALKVDPFYIEEQSKHIAEQAIVSEGRMLVLFTSNLIMSEIEHRLQSRLNEHGITVISQNNANRSALVDRLREAPRKGEKIVLLGVRSFWEGVDIQGAALSTVIVTRLPFEYHNHPVQRAKKIFYESNGHDRDYFREYVVPSTFIHLRQMYGRLIRSERDRGATVITDPRIYSKKYGKALLHSLPESTTIIDNSKVVLDSVKKFLAGEDIESSYVWGGLPYASYELSPEQRAIVESPSKRILVRAAAGSGKTHVLITRLIRLVESSNAKPEDVLALTFTNKAMNVMYDRIENALGGERAYTMHRNVLTYHKLAMRIIRQDDLENETETGFIDEKNPTLQQEFIVKARQKAGITEQSLNFEDALTLIGYAQNGLINETELRGSISSLEAQSPLMAKFANFYLIYIELLREKKLIDYGEAIVQAIRILRGNKDQAQRWSNRFKWIFCDEYQDTSPAQATLLQLLGQQANLFVVGDSYQSIYSWQGSDPDNLRRFEVDFPNTASYYLSKNYRCFPKLVRMSMGFLEKAGELHGVRVEYDHKRSTEDQSVYFLNNTSDEQETETIAKVIKTALALELPGDPPKKATVGVLARKWHLLTSIEMGLLKQGIPYKFEGDTARGILASPKVRKLVEQSANLIYRNEMGQDFGDSIEGKIGQRIKEDKFGTATDLIKAVKQAQTGENLDSMEENDFSQLCDILSQQAPGTLLHFNTNNNEKPCVVLSTIHSQKGEEFDTVIVVGMEEGNSPHEQPKNHAHLIEWRKVVQELSHATWRASITDQDLERIYKQEEKRIFYVAMTRAKYNLVISNCKKRNIMGRSKDYLKSSFLELSSDINLVKEANAEYEISIQAPKIDISNKGEYMTDGRVYETAAGISVRSKSEMLLANEFTRNGIYYEYEMPAENVINALPDFILPHYGNVIIEHLGLINDAEYLSKWNEKALKYEAEGILYLRTNEEEIYNLTQTVLRIKEQATTWCRKKLGSKHCDLIKVIEEIRKSKDLNLEKPTNKYEDGIFEIENNKIKYIVVDSIDIAKIQDGLKSENVSWTKEIIINHEVYFGSIE